VLRFLKSGRYIPCTTLSLCLCRADELAASNDGYLFHRHSSIAKAVGMCFKVFRCDMNLTHYILVSNQDLKWTIMALLRS
jgi:hypothetical protein